MRGQHRAAALSRAADALSALLASPLVEERVKEQLRRQFDTIDPVAPLKVIRDTQQELAACDVGGQPPVRLTHDLGAVLDGLATVWQKIDRPPRGRRKSATTTGGGPESIRSRMLGPWWKNGCGLNPKLPPEL